MDSKIVMFALVILVATPILVGYGMAFEDVEKSTYDRGEVKNVTDLMLNDTAYTSVTLDSYTLNSSVLYADQSVMGGFLPAYVSTTTTPTTVPYASGTLSGEIDLSGYYYIDVRNTDGTYFTCTLEYEDRTLAATGQFKSLVWNKSTGYVEYVYKYSSTTDAQGLMEDIRYITFGSSVSATYSAAGTYYADLTQGWKLPTLPNEGIAPVTSTAWMYCPEYDITDPGGVCDSMVLSMDLGGFLGTYTYRIWFDTGTSNPYVDVILKSEMIEVDSVPTGHTLTVQVGDADPQQIYMNQTVGFAPSSENNWYQLIIQQGSVSFNYIGSISSSFGIMAAYDSVSFDYDYDPYTLLAIQLPYDLTITYRGETAECRAYSYAVMTDATISPDKFSGDSCDVGITSISAAGGSFSWGGLTYAVSDGSVTVSNKAFALARGISLRSIYEDDVYTLYVNDIEVGTTDSAPTLILTGTWDCIVQTAALNERTWTETEWQAGEFAWNGVDESFALVGLLTCVAVFIGLGMYGRRSGAKVGTLMIICGCAAFVFLALL